MNTNKWNRNAIMFSPFEAWLMLITSDSMQRETLTAESFYLFIWFLFCSLGLFNTNSKWQLTVQTLDPAANNTIRLCVFIWQIKLTSKLARNCFSFAHNPLILAPFSVHNKGRHRKQFCDFSECSQRKRALTVKRVSKSKTFFFFF